MRRIKFQKLVGLAGICFIVVIIFGLFYVGLGNKTLVNQSRTNLTLTQIEDQKTIEKWEKNINDLGGDAAYQEFKMQTMKTKTLRQRHRDAHLFGQALYQSMGKEGISVCDSSFDSGCYHSLLGVAINEAGLGVVTELSRQCLKRQEKEIGGCQHGIGHGILSFVGYDLDNLEESIKVCGNLDIADRYIDSCLHGVFMEYNFRTMLLDQGKLRAFDQNNPYFPCNSVVEKSRGVCMNQLAQWLTDTFSQLSSEDKVKKVDQFCSGSGNSDQCFFGFGIKIMAQLNYNYSEGARICHLLSSVQSQKMCQDGVSSHQSIF